MKMTSFEAGNSTSFTEQDFLQRTIDYTLLQQHFLDHASKIGQGYFVLNRGIITPLSHLPIDDSDFEESVYFPAMMYYIYSHAEQMRWSLLDESIPLKTPRDSFRRVRFGLFDGGRYSNALALGMLKYTPALPDLREAMLHDLDTTLQYYCVRSLGDMPKESFGFRKDIRQAILDSTDDYFQATAVKVLGALNDEGAVTMLRELFEKLKFEILQITIEEGFKKEYTWKLMLLNNIIETLIKLDIDAAREILALCLDEDFGHVYHYVKRSFLLSTDGDLVKLMEKSPTITAHFLTKNRH